jgi:hypothetical protein
MRQLLRHLAPCCHRYRRCGYCLQPALLLPLLLHLLCLLLMLMRRCLWVF